MGNLDQRIKQNADRLFVQSYQQLCIDNDRVFAWLLGLQWIAAIIVSLVVTPRTWIGQTSQMHVHVITALTMGALLSALPIYVNWKTPGAVFNRYVNVIAQGFYSALFIHLTGGRIETHFHVFGSLAFFAFYRDIPVLLTGTVIVAVDHLIRGVWFPASAFGIFTTAEWRWLEHAGWVVFEDFFLGYACIRGIKEMKVVAQKTAEVMAQHEVAEQLVELRTGELKQERNVLKKTNETISTIYANVQSGFLLIDSQAIIQEGFTDSIHKLISTETRAGMSLVRALNLNDRQSDHFLLLIEQVFEDVFPEHVSLAQLPTKFSVGQRTIRLEASVVRNAERNVRAVLFTISDISELERTERENQTNKALVTILQQKSSFTHFVSEAKLLLEDCRSALKVNDQQRLRFKLHTLKGNATIFGLDSIAEMIHYIEDESTITTKHIDSVEISLKAFINAHYSVLNLDFDRLADDHFTVTSSQLGQLGRAINSETGQHAPKKVISRWMTDLRRKQAKEMVAPIVKAGSIIADRLGKKVEFEVLNGECLMDSDYLRPVFQNLSHLVRNALDHGVEMPNQRGEKSASAKITIDCSVDENRWVIKVSDDGRGIRVDALVKRAIFMKAISEDQARGLSHEQKLNLIFSDGLSTSDGVSYLSGRGVGMTAVSDAVKSIGGEIKLTSEEGKGTSFVITVPLDPRETERGFSGFESESKHGEEAYPKAV